MKKSIRAFLEHLSSKTDVSQSKLLARALIEKYPEEYEKFIKKYKED